MMKILEQYEDFELAFLYKYKLDTYLEATKNEIKSYLEKRGLDDTKIEKLVVEYSQRTFSDGRERCQRCKSTKIQKEYYLGGIGVSIDCNVCGLHIEYPQKEESKSLLRRIMNVFFYNIK